MLQAACHPTKREVINDLKLITVTNFWCYPIRRHVSKASEPGRVAQSVTCLTTDTRLAANPGDASSIPAWSHTFIEIDHELIFTAFLLPSTDSRRVVVSYK